jgi:hypothetical protein
VTEVCRKNGRKVFPWFSWRIKELRKTDEGGFTLIELLAVNGSIPIGREMCSANT